MRCFPLHLAEGAYTTTNHRRHQWLHTTHRQHGLILFNDLISRNVIPRAAPAQAAQPPSLPDNGISPHFSSSSLSLSLSLPLSLSLSSSPARKVACQCDRGGSGVEIISEEEPPPSSSSSSLSLSLSLSLTQQPCWQTEEAFLCRVSQESRRSLAG